METRLPTELHTVLSRDTGEIPRRATFVNDVLVDLKDAPPGSKECALLSKICEVVRQSRGDPLYTRDVEKLLAQCLQTNDEKAWSALCDDAMCGLFHATNARDYFTEHPCDASCFVWRFQAAISVLQSACILKVFSVCLPVFSQEAIRSFVSSLQGGQGCTLLTAYASHARSLPGRARSLALHSFGMILDDPDVFKSLVMDALVSFPSNPVAEDVLTILMASPQAPMLSHCLVETRHEARSMFLAMAQKAPIPRRAPFFWALSYIVQEDDCAVKEFVVQTLRHSMECPDVFKAAIKVVKVTEPPHDVSGLLATFIHECLKP